MTSKKLFAVLAGIVFSLSMSAQGGIGISNVVMTPTSATVCDTISLGISGAHGCTTSSVTGVSHSISGNTITVTVSYADPAICQGAITGFSTSHTMTGIPPGNYSVLVRYGTNNNNSVTVQLSIASSGVASAGIDSIMCQQSSYILQGNTPPTGVSVSWQVSQGSASLSSTSIPQPTVSNLSYGVNSFIYTMFDPNCTTSDSVWLTNDEYPSFAQTEIDKTSCLDKDSIFATAVTAGTPLWKAITPGVAIVSSNKTNAYAVNLQTGSNLIEFSVSSGSCPVQRDTLKVTYTQYTDTPSISLSGNNLLTSTQAPRYQWYLNGNPINGATSQSHTATSNGVYKVLTSEVACNNGLYSNEIELGFVGLNDLDENAFKVYPNPVKDVLHVEGITSQTKLYLINANGVRVLEKVISANTDLSMDTYPAGIYLLTLENNQQFRHLRLMLE